MAYAAEPAMTHTPAMVPKVRMALFSIPTPIEPWFHAWTKLPHCGWTGGPIGFCASPISDLRDVKTTITSGARE